MLRPHARHEVSVFHMLFSAGRKEGEKKRGGRGECRFNSGLVGTGPETGHVKACCYTP
jgi:hypothetical protein